MTAPYRWKAGESRTSRILRPLAADHPATHHPCPCCGEQLGNGAPVQILAIGPGTDPDEQAAHQAGLWYTAIGLCVHAACLGTPEPAHGEEPARFKRFERIADDEDNPSEVIDKLIALGYVEPVNDDPQT